jgi:hypothetical protein
MILEMIVGGIAVIVVIAIVVGVVDATKAPTWRQIAADRRRDWEARQFEPHGGEPWTDTWQDD